jgi:hypothetical protein
LGEVVIGDTELYRFETSRLLNRFCNLTNTVGRRFGDRQDGCCFAFGFVDLLLLVGFGSFDDLLFFTFGAVDCRVSLPFRCQNERAFFALRPHLLFHRGEHVVGRRNVLDFVAHHFDAPRLGRLVELADYLRIDISPLLERSIELDLAEFAAQRRLRQL